MSASSGASTSEGCAQVEQDPTSEACTPVEEDPPQLSDANLKDDENEVSYPNTSTPAAVDEESSNDSLALQIVLSPSGPRKRKMSTTVDIDKEIEEDIEKELEKKAKRTNLTVKNVKSILRYVIGNESVLTMVRNAMNGEGKDALPLFEPKLTRSKTKELRENKQILWPLSPIKPVPPTDEHLVLIREELPEEEDDDEYKPSADDLRDHSDDESGRLSVTSSCNTSTVGHYLENFDAGLLDDNHSFKSLNDDQTKLVEPSAEEDFHFKRPLLKLPENICQRTRSKYSLSSTPLEAIEQAFIPPDITTDMYDFKCDNEEWENFLKDFMQPLPNDQADADADEEDDPEYNILAEEEEIDREELRRDKGVTVSKSELRTLVMELFQNPEENSSDDDLTKEMETTNPLEVQVPKEVPKGSKEEKLGQEQDKELEWEQQEEGEIRSKTPPPPDVFGVTYNQKLLFQQQLRQHIQLITQHFLQTHKHFIFARKAKVFKVMLAELVELGKAKPKSLINVYNLHKAFAIVEQWENIMETPVGTKVVEHMEKQGKMDALMKSKRTKFVGEFHPELMDLVVNSDVFLYPLLLPAAPFRCVPLTNIEFFPSEDQLIALGYEQFTAHANEITNQNCPDRYKGSHRSICELIQKYLVPVRSVPRLKNRVLTMGRVKGNPINVYKETGKAPSTLHHVIPFTKNLLKPPKDQIPLLPKQWQDFVKVKYGSKKRPKGVKVVKIELINNC